MSEAVPCIRGNYFVIPLLINILHLESWVVLDGRRTLRKPMPSYSPMNSSHNQDPNGTGYKPLTPAVATHDLSQQTSVAIQLFVIFLFFYYYFLYNT